MKGIGRKGELYAMSILRDAVDIAGKQFDAPYDIEWLGLKIDVKTTRYKERTKQYRFNLHSLRVGPMRKRCDYLLFVFIKRNCIIGYTMKPARRFHARQEQFNTTNPMHHLKHPIAI